MLYNTYCVYIVYITYSSYYIYKHWHQCTLDTIYLNPYDHMTHFCFLGGWKREEKEQRVTGDGSHTSSLEKHSRKIVTEVCQMHMAFVP